MRIEGDIESGGGTYPGMKLPHDGQIGFNFSPKLLLSRQLFLEWLSKSREKIRPWHVFFATSRFKTPLTAQRLPRRVVKNIEYFQSNYIFVFAGLFLYCLITSPLLLIAVMIQFMVLYWIYVKNQTKKVVIFGKQLTLMQQYSMVGLCSMPIFYLLGAGSVLFWLIGASCFLIMTHAVFYDIQSLLEPEDESFELTMEQVV